MFSCALYYTNNYISSYETMQIVTLGFEIQVEMH